MIKKCTCKHPGQDQLHGEGNRVWNVAVRKTGNVARCTICGRETDAPRTDTKKDAK
jgi:hypothetical protein